MVWGLNPSFIQPRSLPGVKQPERGADQPPFPNAGLTIGRSYTSTSCLCLHRHVMGWWFYLYLSLIHSLIHSIGMCRMGWFLAVLRSFFHSSLLYTLSFHPFPPTSLPSSLTSSCHLFPITFTYTKYELVYWSLKGMLWGSEVFKSLMSRIPKLDQWTAWIHLSMDSFRDWWYTLRNKTFLWMFCWETYNL
jgi:hypothetical protein